MKLSEVVRKLEENPYREFVSDTISGEFTHAILIASMENGVFRITDDSGKLSVASSERTWKELDRSVGFMTAMRAFIKGKVVYSEWDGEIYEYSDNIFNILTDNLGSAISADEIFTAKWYIKK